MGQWRQVMSFCTAFILDFSISPERQEISLIDSKIIGTKNEMLKWYKNVIVTTIHLKTLSKRKIPNFEKHVYLNFVAMDSSRGNN